jgi:hypothetical protein
LSSLQSHPDKDIVVNKKGKTALQVANELFVEVDGVLQNNRLLKKLGDMSKAGHAFLSSASSVTKDIQHFTLEGLQRRLSQPQKTLMLSKCARAKAVLVSPEQKELNRRRTVNSA